MKAPEPLGTSRPRQILFFLLYGWIAATAMFFFLRFSFVFFHANKDAIQNLLRGGG